MVEYSYGYFHSKIEIITQTTNLTEMYETVVNTILEKVDTYQNEGSGWQFKKVINLDWMQRIVRDGEWEWERLLAEWGKSGHPRLRG